MILVTKEGLAELADTLTARIEGINEWIKNNPDTDPNFYEIMDCYVDYASLVSTANDYYTKAGYPMIKKRRYYDANAEKAEAEATQHDIVEFDPNIMAYDEVEVKATHYDIINFDPNIRACDMAMKEMLRLRRVWWTDEKGGFASEQDVHDFLMEFHYRAAIGEYHVPENPMLAQMKKEILCKSMSIPFYIWQEQRTNPDYRYDNEGEFTTLKKNYGIYQTAVGIQFSTIDLDGNRYDGPQFGQGIEALIDRVEKNYKYSDVYNGGGKVH